MSTNRTRPFALTIQLTYCYLDVLCGVGFLEKEIEKAEINVSDNGDVPDAPPPANMIELEVSSSFYCQLLENLS